MEKKKTIAFKDVAVVVVFMGFLFSFAIWNLLVPDQELSTTERRHLKQFSDLTSESIFSAKFSENLEEYLLDQFVLREEFRTLKAYFQFDVLQMKDNNDIYVREDSVAKLEYPLKESSVVKAAEKFNAICEKFFPGNTNVYYGVIPDKNYYLASKHGFPSVDYGKIETLMAQTLKNMTAIPLYDTLSIEDFYATDSHWRQECLEPVVNRIGEIMGHQSFDAAAWTPNRLTPFYGVYYGQSALPLPADEIVYLTSDVTENAVVYDYETEKETTVYAPDKFHDPNVMDGYDVFLHGARMLLKIENPNAASDRELVIFRDSFGSSLVPLLIGEYRTIYVVDIRYIAVDYISEKVTFPNHENTDVLFLYNTVLLNNSEMLK